MNITESSESSASSASSASFKSVQSIRGMPDILPKDAALFAKFEADWRRIMRQYGYSEIILPILESTRLFKRSIGEVTDIVEKEMFTFSDRDGESVTLRPEGTAGAVRAGLEHGLLYNQTQRLWYIGPMFRYERPQKGRYRQFFQVGIEAFGFAGPDIDAEQIFLSARLWEALGVSEGLVLEVNSLGCDVARARYRSKLVDYFNGFYDLLDEDSKRRLTTNPLRILDSKNPALASIINNAPKCLEYLEPDDKKHFEAFLELLTKQNIKYRINPRLVRGLDYYNKTVYEWVTDRLGAQGTVCAGGRYDKLVETLGGKSTPGVGFAIGIDRAVLLMKTFNITVPENIDVYCIFQGENTQTALLVLIESLRTECKDIQFVVHCGEGSFKNQFKKADKSGAEIALILGEEELAQKTLSIKFLRTVKDQLTLPLSEVGNWLNNHFTHGK